MQVRQEENIYSSQVSAGSERDMQVTALAVASREECTRVRTAALLTTVQLQHRGRTGRCGFVGAGVFDPRGGDAVLGVHGDAVF